MNITSLVVDDDELIVYLHKIVLKEAGFKTIYAAQEGKVALELLNQISKDHNQKCLIFLDINMPVMNGWEFLEEFNNKIFDIPISIIMVTSSVNAADREKAFSFDKVIDYIEKPMTIEKAQKVLERAQNT